MKELTEEFKDSEVKSEIVAPEKREHKLTGRMNPIPGLTLWEYEMKTGTLRKAVFKYVTVELEGDHKRQVTHKRVDSKEHHIYFQALNYKSAKRKLEKNDYYVKPENKDGKQKT